MDLETAKQNLERARIAYHRAEESRWHRVVYYTDAIDLLHKVRDLSRLQLGIGNRAYQVFKRASKPMRNQLSLECAEAKRALHEAHQQRELALKKFVEVRDSELQAQKDKKNCKAKELLNSLSPEDRKLLVSYLNN